MAVYNPPTEDLPIFDNSVFTSGNELLTVDIANNNYLKFPLAQGAETLTDITVLGTSTFNGTETHNNTATFTDVIKIANGNTGNATTFDMNGSNNLTINNGTNGGNIFFNIKDATSGVVSNTVSLTTGGGLSSGCSLPLPNANINNFTASSSSTPAVMYIGLSAPGGSYNGNVQANDCFIVATNGINNGALTLTTWTSNAVNPTLSSGSVRIRPSNVTMTGATINLNATDIGGLTSTTPQPGPTDSSNKIPTTAWVQSAITTGGIVPLFLRGYKFITNTNIDWPITFGTIPINFTNGASLPINSNFTIRFSIRYDFNITSSTAQSNLFYSAYGNLNIYPNRVSTNTLAVPVYLNGSLNGSSTYGYSDVTVAPRGRYIWTENFSNPEILDGTNRNFNPIFITSVNQASLTLNLGLPYQGTLAPTNNCAISIYLELINDCVNTAVSTGSTTFFDSIEKNF